MLLSVHFGIEHSGEIFEHSRHVTPTSPLEAVSMGLVCNQGLAIPDHPYPNHTERLGDLVDRLTDIYSEIAGHTEDQNPEEWRLSHVETGLFEVNSERLVSWARNNRERLRQSATSNEGATTYLAIMSAAEMAKAMNKTELHLLRGATNAALVVMGSRCRHGSPTGVRLSAKLKKKTGYVTHRFAESDIPDTTGSLWVHTQGETRSNPVH